MHLRYKATSTRLNSLIAMLEQLADMESGA